MTTVDPLSALLQTVHERDIRLYCEGTALRYEAPPGALDAAVRAGLREHKAALIALLGQGASQALITPGGDPYPPLSLQQERLWLVSRVQHEPVLHLPLVAVFDGMLDPVRLHAALSALVARHSVLHTTFASHQGRWYQRLEPHAGIALPASTLDVNHDNWQECLMAEAHAFNRLPFDPQREILLRAACVALPGAGRSALLMVAHHAALDAIAIGHVFAELVAAYEGSFEPAAPEALRYIDYAQWQRLPRQREQLTSHADSYAALLEGAPGLHRLPLDRDRPAQQSFRGAQLRRLIEPARVQALQELCQGERATLFMGLQAAFALLLCRYSGDPEVLLGTPAVNRSLPQLAALVGCLVNMVPLRVKVDGAASFAQLLGQVREFNTQAYALQAVPLDMLLDRLGIAHNAAHHPLYQITIGLQPESRSVRLRELGCELLTLAKETSQQDIGLDLTPGPDGLLARWEYNTDLFDQATIESMAVHFEQLLTAACAAPAAPLYQLACAPASELPLRTPGPGGQGPLGARFAASALAYPELCALALGDERLSYRQLLARAETMAAQLAQLGVGPGAMVGISTERVAGSYVAMLACALLLAAYVPLDPAYPPERIQAMAEQAGVAVVLGGDALLDAYPVACGATAYHYDELGSGAAPFAAPAAAALALALVLPAYLMFSSGSTGIPKAIVATNAGVARLAGATSWLSLAPGQVCLHAATLAFDAATFEIWSTWLQGGCVAVLEPAILLQPQELGAFIERHRAEVAFFTTAYFNRLAIQAPSVLGQLRRVLFGGEAVSNAAVATARQACPDTEFVHVYGPTENTTFSTGQVLAATLPAARAVPIGALLNGDVGYVLDAQMAPVPVGAIGELYLGGCGLALGYHGAGAATASQFVPDPFGADAGARLYRSGDLVRRLSGGMFEFVRRRDRQVKINGYRIEPGEVEQVLRSSLRVADCAVLVHEVAGQHQLCAYVSARAGHALSADDLRAVELRALPAYLQPAAVIVLDAMPLNRNGKLDLLRLPPPGAPDSRSGARPMSQVEQAVAAIWLDSLGQLPVDPDEDFFELGGNSLQAMSMCHLMQERLGVAQVPLAAFFATPTVAFLAALVRQPDPLALQEVDL